MTGMIYHRPARRTPEAVIAETAAMASSPAFDRVARLARSGFVFTGDVPDVPVTIAWDTHDRILSPTQATRAAHQLPRATQVTLPLSGHVPMNDNPALVTQVILKTSAG